MGLFERIFQLIFEKLLFGSPDAACKTQLLKRAQEQPDNAFTDTVETYDAISKYFEPSSASKSLNILLVDRSNIYGAYDRQ